MSFRQYVTRLVTMQAICHQFGCWPRRRLGDNGFSMTEGKFPNGLADAMKAKGYGPTRLANEVGESKQNIDRWAKGLRRLTPEAAKRIAPILEVTAEHLLLLGAPSPPRPPAAKARKRSDVIAVLKQIDIKEDGIEPLLSLISVYLKPAEPPPQDQPHGQSEPSSRPHGSEPSRSKSAQRTS